MKDNKTIEIKLKCQYYGVLIRRVLKYLNKIEEEEYIYIYIYYGHDFVYTWLLITLLKIPIIIHIPTQIYCFHAKVYFMGFRHEWMRLLYFLFHWKWHILW